MKNILFISSCPFPIKKGSNQHAYFTLKALSTHFNVYCLFFIPPWQELQTDRVKIPEDLGICKYERCSFSEAKQHNKYIMFLKKILAFPTPYVNQATNINGLKKICQFINDFNISIVHIEHMHYFKYIFYLPKKIKKIVVYHDLHHAVYLQQSKFEKRPVPKFLLILYGIKFALFQRLLDSKVTAKIFLNPVEMGKLYKKSIYIPHIVNPEIRYNRVREVSVLTLLFLGAYSHPPNRFAVEFMLNKIVPILVKTVHKFNLQIVGSEMEHFRQSVERSRYKDLINIKGYVDDINYVFSRSDIAVFPILYGGGIKTKVIEAMAGGVPVVTTPAGVSGLMNLPDNCVGVGRTSSEIASEVVLLMRSFELRCERSRRGRSYVEKELSFEELSHRIFSFYQKL